MPRCQHPDNRIQQFTDICLDCDHNIHETDEEYEIHLDKQLAIKAREKQEALRKIRIEEKERILGIKR